MNPKKKKAPDFPLHVAKAWEDGDCVNFAAALARLTGWLLEVDWWSPSDSEDAPESIMKSLRAHVADNHDQVFDLTGIKKITSYHNHVLMPIVKDRGKGYGGVRTRYYSEEKFMTLPLRVRPDESRIKAAMDAILTQKTFLEKVPKRQPPLIPAHLAADYTYGRCAVFASANQALRKFPATALIAHEFGTVLESKPGYIHSFNRINEFEGEDSWGRQPIELIAQRFGATRYTLSEEEHKRVDATLRQNSGDKYTESFAQAEELIKTFFDR